MSDTTLVDTGFWIAFFDARDPYHNRAQECADYLEICTLIVPWPILYETLRTKFVRRPDALFRFDSLMKRPNVNFVEDNDYCKEAYTLVIEYFMRCKRFISMADMLCRLLILDSNIRIQYLLTTNEKDFSDVCAAQKVQLLL